MSPAPSKLYIVFSRGGAGGWIELCTRLLIAAGEGQSADVLLRYGALEDYAGHLARLAPDGFWTPDRVVSWCKTQGAANVAEALTHARQLLTVRFSACSTSTEVLRSANGMTLPPDLPLEGITGFVAEAGGAGNCVWVG